MGKRVAVIGAGITGIGATSSLLEEDLQPVCFERNSDYGGLWRYRDDNVEGVASVMKSTITNTSKEISAASNMPPPAHFPNYMHHTLFLEYIDMFVERNQLQKYMRFNHSVLLVEPTQDYEETGRWSITTKDSTNNLITTEDFDGVMVCTGHHVFPNIPIFKDQEKFNGAILHSHSLKTVQAFEKQNVVVVGVGSSGLDAAVELTNVAKQVYLSTRRGTWVFSRLATGGLPADIVFVRRIFLLLQRIFPYKLVCAVVEAYIKRQFDPSLYGLTPKHAILSQHPTVSDVLASKMISGSIVVKKNIEKFTENGILFENHEEETMVDTVILATGYRIKFPFLKEDILSVTNNRTVLYKLVYPPQLPHATLAILGLVQPNGPGFPVGELQCRWSARIMSGKCKLPSKDIMYADIRARDVANRKRYVNSQRHTLEVDFLSYQEELSAIIGVKPNLWKLAFVDPKLWWALMMGPLVSYQYRLQGPHAWAGARDAILTCHQRVMTPMNGTKRINNQSRYKKLKSDKSAFEINTVFCVIAMLTTIYMTMVIYMIFI